MKIKGTVVYKNINSGFWGIEGDNGEQYLPVNMPEQLKEEGAQVIVSLQEMPDAISMNMWGVMAKITSFETIGS